jgi:23S rRNA (cytidine1920-2'-O)/16S rRNA (cytidine1409-2'-O)-methyltransferase
MQGTASKHDPAQRDAPSFCPKSASKKRRLDQALVGLGLCPSREHAQRAIMAGRVIINDYIAKKPSDAVGPQDRIRLTRKERFVSRGGCKLDHALNHFQLIVAGETVADLGASTGGFTDCVLQRDAAKVYAVDVGHGQLSWKLRCDPRVVVLERTNARELTPQKMPAPFTPAGLVLIDCSFISLRKIIPAAIALLRPSGKILALVKPQFEAGKCEADRGRGVITDPAIHARVLKDLKNFAERITKLKWLGVTESPLLGPAGNKEFFILLEKNI